MSKATTPEHVRPDVARDAAELIKRSTRELVVTDPQTLRRVAVICTAAPSRVRTSSNATNAGHRPALASDDPTKEPELHGRSFNAA